MLKSAIWIQLHKIDSIEEADVVLDRIRPT
jgi:hypothetical protein